MVVRLRVVAAFLCLFFSAPMAPASGSRPIILASTTSTENSGLYEAILPQFEKRFGEEVRVVAVGTGQAIRIAEAGDADVLLVHDRSSEERFVEQGYGLRRLDVMANDFVIVGPASDPAAISGEKDAALALAKIAASGSPFLSRGDDSGTHKAELRVWRESGVDPSLASGRWYREVGSGMGATLNTAVAMEAYTLSDRGTWLSFRNRGDLAVLVEGEPRLMNPYSVIAVNPTRHPHVNAEGAQRLIEWLRSQEGQAAIGDFRLGGERLFLPNADGAIRPGT